MRLRAVPAVCAAAILLSACATRAHYGVTTHIDPISGTCDHARNVEVGASLDLSGPQSALGHEYLTGVQMAVADVNRSGGILKNHSCLELLYKDDRGDGHIGDRAVLDLVNDEVVAFMVGPFESSSVAFAGADLGLAGVPNTDFSSLNQLHAASSYPMTFATAPSNRTTASALVAYAKSQHWSRVAVAAVDDVGGRQALSDFEAAAEPAGLALAGAATIDGDAGAGVDQLSSTRPDGLIVLGDSLAVGPILSARTQARWTVPTVAAAVAADQAVAARAGTGVSVLVPAAAVTTSQEFNPALRSFAARLKLSTGSVIPYAEAYDGVSMLAYAANSINSTHAANVRTFLENANYQGLLASYGYTSSRHTGVATEQLSVVGLDKLSGGLFGG
ncbi:MAG TPA: ABC transporter substrate-binding protein [Candidatus Dormibacteraeota bacterium]|nr:ABC transporter substrate-binding protein [Candidatus Dormibacteraeota bacterium]